MADYITYVGSLCRQQSRRTLLDYFYDQWMNNGEWHTTGDIMEATGLARTSVTENIELFLDTNLVESKSDDKRKHPLYRPVANSATFKAIQQTNEVLNHATDSSHDGGEMPLTDLYGGSSRAKLVDYFIHTGIEWSEDDEPLTKVDVYEGSSVTRKSIIEEIDTLINYEIVVVDESFSYPRYEPAKESEAFQKVVSLNELLDETISNSLREV